MIMNFAFELNFIPMTCDLLAKGWGLRATFFSLISVPSLCLLAIGTPAQIPPLKPPPLATQVPQGSGACSVEKSCADLAPQMIVIWQKIVKDR